MPTTAPSLNELADKFERLSNVVCGEIVEREKAVHAALNALVSKKHHYQIGPPGTAKSFLVTRIVKRIEGLSEDDYFRWLLTNYTTPEELYGVPSVPHLREGMYYRITDRKLPKARIAFLDEIFKGNSSILNANLTIMNERLFFNGDDDPNVPLCSMFAASNELPHSEELHALWDRLHFRLEIKPLTSSSSFIRMLGTFIDPNPDPILSWDDIAAAQQIVSEVHLPSEIFDQLKTLRDELKEKGIEVTERRWMESLDVIRGEAFLNKRLEADIDDMRPLRHLLWARLEDQREVEKSVLQLANPIDREADDLLERLEQLEVDLRNALQDADNPRQAAKQAVEVHGKLSKAKSRIDDLKRRAEDSNRRTEKLQEVKDKFIEVARKLMNEGFGVEGEPGTSL